MSAKQVPPYPCQPQPCPCQLIKARGSRWCTLSARVQHRTGKHPTKSDEEGIWGALTTRYLT
jgi:hypothetical protein